MPEDPHRTKSLLDQGFHGKTLSEKEEAWREVAPLLTEELRQKVDVSPELTDEVGRMVGEIMAGVVRKKSEVEERSAFPRIRQEVEARHSRPYRNGFAAMLEDPNLPVGHRRMFAHYFFDAEWMNGGLEQYFCNGLGGLTVPAIEAYEKAGQFQLAQVMKIALKICVQGRPSPEVEKRLQVPGDFWEAVANTNFRVPPGFLDDVDAVGKVFDDLCEELSDLMERLPTVVELGDSRRDGFVTWYYETFPEDFAFSQ